MDWIWNIPTVYCLIAGIGILLRRLTGPGVYNGPPLRIPRDIGLCQVNPLGPTLVTPQTLLRRFCCRLL